MERHRKLHGRRLDHDERLRKRIAREGHKASKDAQNLRGLRAKLYQSARRKEKIQMKKQIRAHQERNVKTADEKEPSTPMPAYLLDRTNPTTAKALSSAIKNKRADKAARFAVPLPKVKGISEEEMFSVVKTGRKTAKKAWKRMVTKPTFVGPDFTRRNPKYERFIRPMGLRKSTPPFALFGTDKSGCCAPRLSARRFHPQSSPWSNKCLLVYRIQEGPCHTS
jgi:ribosome biogenesis protein NSA2